MALSLSDKVAVMASKNNEGFIAQFASPEMVYNSPETPDVARLTGRCLIIEGDATGSEAKTILGPIRLQNQQQGTVQIVVRPESLQFKEGAGTCTVLFCACLGANFQLTVRCNQQKVQLYSTQAVSIGTKGELFCAKPCWAIKKT